jgi:polyhydroxybutyrate depolymerase
MKRSKSMATRVRFVLSSLAVVVAVFAAFAFWALYHTSPPKPELSGRIEPGELQHDGRSRSWTAYLPAQLAPHPALVIVLHGSMGSGQQARTDTFGYDFDLLADHHGFIAVYPQGYEGEWNDSRVMGPFPAKRENIDDVGFLHALVQRFVKDHDAIPGASTSPAYPTARRWCCGWRCRRRSSRARTPSSPRACRRPRT